MKVVLDTTVLFRDPWLEGNHAKALRKDAARGGFRVVLPEVVVREAVAKYRERVIAAGVRIEKTRRELTALRCGSNDLPVLDTEAMTQLYESHLRRLAGAEVEIASIPNVPHELLVDRDIGDIKPFTGGRGYRDALIWETAVAVASEGACFLVTANTSDFCEPGSTELALALSIDLEERELSPGAVVIYGDIETFVRAELPRDEVMRKRISDGRADGELLDVVRAAGEELLAGFEFADPGSLRLPTDSDSASIELAEISEVVVSEVFDLHDGTFAVDFEVTANADIDVFVPKWNALDDATVTVIDPDWNESFVFAATTREVAARISAVFDPESDEARLTGFEVEDVHGTEW